tara:strand:- start:248 stop:730 length:483 start_codon:yes stop_codon:yes gene_type:complete
VKYHRLTHKQFEELHEQFSVFLETQGMDHSKWDAIKTKNSDQVDTLLDLFSDLVWDKISSECKFLEYISKDHLFLFKTFDYKAFEFVIKISDKTIDLTSSEAFKWVLNNFNSDNVILFQGSKAYGTTKNDFVYSYLKKGAIRTDGHRFIALETYFSNSAK